MSVGAAAGPTSSHLRSLAYALVKDGEIESVRIGRLRRIPAATWTA